MIILGGTGYSGVAKLGLKLGEPVTNLRSRAAHVTGLRLPLSRSV